MIFVVLCIKPIQATKDKAIMHSARLKYKIKNCALNYANAQNLKQVCIQAN